MTYANFRKNFELFAIQILQPCFLIYGNLRLSSEVHGVAISARTRNPTNVRTTKTAGHHSPTTAVCRVRVRHLDQQQHAATRSNNDEGWHHGLHRRATGRQNVNLYLLIYLLHQEARLTALPIRLVSEKKNLQECSRKSTGPCRPKSSSYGKITSRIEEARSSCYGIVPT